MGIRIKNIFTIFLIFCFCLTPTYSQVGGDAAGIAAEGGDSGDGADSGSRGSRGGDSADSADANNKKEQARNNSRINRYIPKGVQQFSKTYPKTHFRFVSGDILSAAFFESTGLFGFVAGSDPLNNSVERTGTTGRHAGLVSFVTTAKIGGVAIDGIENKINKKLGIKESKQIVTSLKNLAGLNVMAGAYSYFAVNAALNGASSEEIADMLTSRDTLAAVISLHLGFYTAGKVVDGAKAVGANLKLISEIQKNPRALAVMEDLVKSGRLAGYADLLKDAKKANEVRQGLSKAKIALGTLQPETIPAIVAATIVEWTAYYAFAKIWDKLIHEQLITGLAIWDKFCSFQNSNKAYYYALGQKGLIFDDVILESAKNIQRNFEVLTQLMYAPLVDEQMKLIEKSAKLDYLVELYNQFDNLSSLEDQKEFLKELLDKNHPMFELNKQFITWLGESSSNFIGDDIDIDRLYSLSQTIHEIDNPKEYEKPYSNNALGASDIGYFAKRANQKTYRGNRDAILESMLGGLNDLKSKNQEAYEQNLMANVNEELKVLVAEQKEWASKADAVGGMDLKSIEASYEKYGLDPNQDITEQSFNPEKEIPAPTTVFEVMLVQGVYLNDLKEFAYSEDIKEEIDEIHARSELANFIQAGAIESIQNESE